MNVEATIAELVPGGDGVAIVEVDGERRAVFVPGVDEGERVRIAADFARRPARGRLLEILSPSAARVTPACPHQQSCGGCDYMFLTADAQRKAHAAIVARILPRAFAGTHVTSHPAPETVGYRARARLQVESNRGSAATVVGFRRRRTHAIAAIDSCLVLAPEVDAARALLPALLAGARGTGEARLSLGANRRPVIELSWSGDLPKETFARVERAVKDGAIAGARLFAGEVKTPATIGDPTPIQGGADGAPLRLAPGGFSQASEAGNAELAHRVRDLAREAPPGACVELYCGAGNLTVLLARDRGVVAVESDREACAAARENLQARGLRAKVVEADAAGFAIPRSTKLVVLDPPRTGAREVAQALARSKVTAVVYVSCDPPTLGRDLEILAAGGYTLSSVETFEMFPQTSHVETVASLRRT